MDSGARMLGTLLAGMTLSDVEGWTFTPSRIRLTEEKILALHEAGLLMFEMGLVILTPSGERLISTMLGDAIQMGRQLEELTG